MLEVPIIENCVHIHVRTPSRKRENKGGSVMGGGLSGRCRPNPGSNPSHTSQRLDDAHVAFTKTPALPLLWLVSEL